MEGEVPNTRESKTQLRVYNLKGKIKRSKEGMYLSWMDGCTRIGKNAELVNFVELRRFNSLKHCNKNIL